MLVREQGTPVQCRDGPAAVSCQQSLNGLQLDLLLKRSAIA